ncbi:MAG: hypothetical protein KBA46_00550 [Candidatus Omnitrophica bacterium]|nr:hypothetical protein [Candidatus Omnitrophota bacterium]
MKAEVKKLEGTKRELSIEVGKDIVKKKFEDVFVRISKEAKVPGFRPGHAPRDILEKHFSQDAHQQVLKELIPDIYHQAIEQEKLDVIELPEISDVKLDRENLSFKAKVEVSPEFDLKEYKGIAVTYAPISVSPEEIKRSIDSFKESRKIDTIDDSFARGLGYPSVAQLEKAIESQLYLKKENAQRQDIEQQILNFLLKDITAPMPQSLIERQLQEMLRQAKVDLALRGVPREKIDAQDAELLKEMRPEAERQVKVYLLLSQIAKKEAMAIDDHMPGRVMEFLLKEATWKESSK